MDKYKYIFFDLDGTVTNPKVGITSSVAYALNKYGIEVKDKDTLCKFIGPPLRNSFKEYYNFSDQMAEDATEYFREYFASKGIFENILYDGMKELLLELKKSGKKIVLATSKPEVYGVEILKHFNIDKYFDYICGSNLDGTRENKDEVIKYAIETCGADNIDNIIMVGDRKYDVLGAKKLNIDCIGVTYGFGDNEELYNAGAKYVVNTISELKNILL